MASGNEAFEEKVWSFFENYCVDCHDDTITKGGLDLFAVIDESIEGSGDVDLWTQIFDRVDHGEMPPKKKTRPDAGDIDKFLSWIKPRLINADLAEREVVHRRLNREEYENTVHDLLGITTDLKDLLPADQSAGGFDNNGGALAVSPELFLRYLEAAGLAIDSAIHTGEKPEVENYTMGPEKELQPYLGKQYFERDGHWFVYMRSRGAYSKISSRARRASHAGKYRIKFSAMTLNTDEPVVFSAVITDQKGVGSIVKNVGYFEAHGKPKTFELEVEVPKDAHIQMFTQSLPYYVKNPKPETHAAVGYSDFEWTGPIYEQWPPKSHTSLLGDCDLENGTLGDAEKVIRKLMPRAYRRPITEADLVGPMNVVKSRIDAGQNFFDSLQAGLEAVLCSPNFLYLTESPSGLTPHEKTSRLSYFLWNSMPDDQLLAAAGKGGKDFPANQVERMLADPKSSRFVENFTGQWLKLREIDDTTPDSKLYSSFDEILQVSMVRESHGFFAHLLKENLPISNFLDSDFAMLNSRLAEHYEIPDVTGFEIKPVRLPEDSVRGGVLTQAAVLKVTANGTNTSPVMRGVWVNENILGRHSPPPPPNIEGIEPDIREATTIREQLDLHRNADSCAGCHQYIDPPGFALESFDPIGGFREQYLQFKVNPQHADKGWGSVIKAKPVDASGEMADGDAFAGFEEFRNLLIENKEQFAYCLTERLATYALGREMGFSDRAALQQIVENTKNQGDGFRTLIRELVASPLFSRP